MSKLSKILILFAAFGVLGGCQGVDAPPVDCDQEPTAQGCEPKPTKFPAPTNLAAEAIDQTSIHLTWTKPATSKTFQIQIQMKIGTSDYAIVKEVDGDVIKFDVNHLHADTDYTFRIRAMGDTESDYTSEVSSSTMSASINPLFPKPTLTSTVTSLGVVTLSKSWTNTSSLYVAGIQYQIMAEGNYVWSLLGSGLFGSSYAQNNPPAGILQYKITVVYTDGSIFADEAGYVISKLLPPTNVTGEAVDVLGTMKHKINWEYGTSPNVQSGYILNIEYINTSSVATSSNVTLPNNTVKTYTVIPACLTGTPVKYRVKATSGNALIQSSDLSSPEFVIDCP